MKTQKLYRILILFAFFPLVFGSCSKDRDDELSLFGNWVEEAPVPQRTEIYFYPENKIGISYPEGSREEYFYRIEDETIFLGAEHNFEDEEAAWQLFFKQIDENTFQIQNFYISIPENDPTYIIFGREIL